MSSSKSIIAITMIIEITMTTYNSIGAFAIYNSSKHDDDWNQKQNPDHGQFR